MIIVGAGIIGLSCAWRLAQRGVSVEIFDAREAAREASWAGAGMLAPGGEITSASPLAQFALDSLRAWPDFIDDLEEETGRAIDYRRSGAIEVALDDGEAEALDRRSADQSALGIRSESCLHNGLRARFYSDDAVVDPRHVTGALIAACRRRGLTIHEHEPVLEIMPGGKGVITGKAKYTSDAVLIAAGAWSSELFPGLPETIPVRGHLISWQLKPATLDPILRHGHTYLMQRRSGVLIGGTTTEHVGFERAIDEKAVDEIRLKASQLLPMLEGLPVGARWNGFRPGIEAEFPAVGRVPGTSVWTAFGHYRNGILLAPETARRIADSITSSP